MATFPLGLNTVSAIPRFPVTTDVMKLDVYPWVLSCVSVKATLLKNFESANLAPPTKNKIIEPNNPAIAAATALRRLFMLTNSKSKASLLTMISTQGTNSYNNSANSRDAKARKYKYFDGYQA